MPAQVVLAASAALLAPARWASHTGTPVAAGISPSQLEAKFKASLLGALVGLFSVPATVIWALENEPTVYPAPAFKLAISVLPLAMYRLLDSGFTVTVAVVPPSGNVTEPESAT